MSGRRDKAAMFARLPPLWPEELRPRIRAAVAAGTGHKVVVLDEDPTGTQSVHGVPVLTHWDEEALRAEMNHTEACFHLLTNTRRLAPEEARARVHEVARAVRAAAGTRPVTLIARSDSMLRSHFSLETEVLSEVLGPFHATLLIPYFEAGGRCTIEDIHYTTDGDLLVPVAETGFARDPTFGFRSSNLREYVAEKLLGRVSPGDVFSIGLTELRQGGPKGVTARLRSLPLGALCVVNAAAPSDLDVFVMGLLEAEGAGGRYCLRTSPQFCAARLGLEPPPFITAQMLDQFQPPPPRQMPPAPPTRDYSTSGPTAALPKTEPGRKPNPLPASYANAPARENAREDETAQDKGSQPTVKTGALIVVGSHVSTTNRQLARLLDSGNVWRCELKLDQLLSARRRQVMAGVAVALTQALATGQDAVLFASHAGLRPGAGHAADLPQITQRLAEVLIELVRGLEVRPRYLLAKGGVTLSALATDALGARRAVVLGQLLPGVTVWRLGLETRFPGLPYVVFPGNVGGPDALEHAVAQLSIPPASPTSD